MTPFVQHAKGIAEYRRNRYESATEWLRKSVEGMTLNTRWAAAIRTTSLFFSAMAYHHLGRTEESRERLVDAEREADAFPPEWHNQDRLVMQAVRREAKALVLGEEADGE